MDAGTLRILPLTRASTFPFRGWLGKAITLDCSSPARMLVTLLVFALWQSVSEKPQSTLETPVQRAKKKSKRAALINAGRVLIRAFRYRKGDPQLLMLGYFFYSVLGLVLLLLMVLPTAEPSFRAEAVVVTTMLVFSGGLAWLIVTDQPTMHFVRARKRLKRWFADGRPSRSPWRSALG